MLLNKRISSPLFYNPVCVFFQSYKWKCKDLVSWKDSYKRENSVSQVLLINTIPTIKFLQDSLG